MGRRRCVCVIHEERDEGTFECIQAVAQPQRWHAVRPNRPIFWRHQIHPGWPVGSASAGKRSNCTFRSRSLTDRRLNGFHSAISHSSTQGSHRSRTTPSGWSTLRRELHLIAAWPARWGSAGVHFHFAVARVGQLDRSVLDRRAQVRLVYLPLDRNDSAPPKIAWVLFTVSVRLSRRRSRIA